MVPYHADIDCVVRWIPTCASYMLASFSPQKDIRIYETVRDERVQPFQ